MANGRPCWPFRPMPNGHRPPETGGHLKLLQRNPLFTVSKTEVLTIQSLQDYSTLIRVIRLTLCIVSTYGIHTWIRRVCEANWTAKY